MADYEGAGMLVFREVFGQNVEAEGCWFHFAQAVVRKAKKIVYLQRAETMRKQVNVFAA